MSCRFSFLLVLGTLILFTPKDSFSQKHEYNDPEFDFSKGIGIKSPDSSFFLNLIQVSF
jgi:hypothetical protein